MSSYLQLAIAWLLFLAIPALAGGLFYRAWKIVVRKEWRYVAPWHGATVPDPDRWAAWFAAINMLAGAILAGVLIAILVEGLEFSAWSGAVALTIWIYYIVTQLMARKARAIAAGFAAAGK